MLLIEFSSLSNETNVKFEHVMVLSMCIAPMEIFTDYLELFWDDGILFYMWCRESTYSYMKSISSSSICANSKKKLETTNEEWKQN